MSSLRFEEDRSRKGWRLQFYTPDKKKRSLWIGEASKTKALGIQRHVEELARAKKLGQRPEDSTILWLEGIEGRIREALVKWDLCKPAEAKLNGDASNYLIPFVDHYLKLRTDLKPITIKKFDQTKDYANRYFGDRKPLESITDADFEQWLRWMKADRLKADGKTVEKGLASATATKHAKRLRQILEFAVKSRLLKSNPGKSLKLGAEVNPDRQFFITQPMADAILEQCPDIVWKLIFSLPRFAGFRCPTEVLALRWSDVDFEKGRLRVDSVKTGLRFCPIFPKLATILEEAWAKAAEDSPTRKPPRDSFVVFRTRYYSLESNMRTQLSRIITAAGFSPWEKLFVNLRSSCRTELEEQFPTHVVNAWMGHSTRVAEQHYLQVTEDHWNKARGSFGGDILKNGGSTGGDVPSGTEKSGIKKTNKKKGQRSRKDSRELAECPRKDSNLGPAD